MTYFGDILASALNRREFIKLASASAVLYTAGEAYASKSLTYKTLYPNNEDRITVPQGYEYDILIKWGDPLDNGPSLNWNRIFEGLTAEDIERQKHCFGYNCDYVGFFRLSENRAILVVNHEYTNPELMFSDFNTTTWRPSVEQSRLMLYAHGLSIVEIRKKGNRWEYVRNSRYNRRIHGETECIVSGPAAGHTLMRTSYDPTGMRVKGTLNNCSGGKTPWGTVLTCEENFHSYFGGNIDRVNDQTVKELHERYGVPNSLSVEAYGFVKFDKRFNVEAEPNEPFRFGWVVEIDPYDPNRPPIKRTALGRFKHEAANTVVAPDGRVVVYMGDDERFEYIYKFITRGTYNPTDRESNFKLLDEGSLYVARFNEDFTGEWIKIAEVVGNTIIPNPKLPEKFKKDPVLCFINTRGAADALGAIKMDRPEDVEWNPITKTVFVALTFNERRTRLQTDKPNPRGPNLMGHIIEIMEEGKNPTSGKFKWTIPVLCGDPTSKEQNRKLIIYGRPASYNVPAISAPDNFAFDKAGNLWIATDGNPRRSRLSRNDGVYTLNIQTREFKMFLSGVPGCEICGPEFSDDYKTFFCAIQHPGENPMISAGPMVSRWPYLNDGVQVPRPSVIQVWRTDGREVYL
ncbi:PhoX family protein [Thermocrinis sp.]